MAEGVGALGFAQTPEANYDSILKAQSQVNRQAASMARTQMSSIQRANAQSIKDAKEQQDRIEDLKSKTIESVMYSVPHHSDVIGPLASQIAQEDSRIPLQRAEQGLAITFEQANTINLHDQTIKDFSNRLNEEFNALETAGYYRIPIIKEAYRQHLFALNNGDVPGVGPKTIVNGAPTITEYMAGPGGRFQPLGDELLSSFIMEDKYWTSWFDDYNQKIKSSTTEGATLGSTNITEGVSAQTSQFTVYDPELETVRPKTADEIVNEGLIQAWFQDNRNYEGAVLLRNGAMDIIAQNKAAEASGEGSDYIMVGNSKVKISNIDPADNGTPLAYTYLQAQVLSERVSTFGMDNTDLNIRDIERRSMTIVNQQREEGIKDTSYDSTFRKLSQIFYNEGNVLSKQLTTVINGKEVVDVSDFFPSASMRTSEVGTSRPIKSFHYDPSTREFIVSYATQKKGATYKTEYETLNMRSAVANINFFDGYRQQNAEQYLNKKKAFDVTSDAIDLSKFRKGSPSEYSAPGVAFEQLSTMFKSAIDESISRKSSRALREVINNTPGGVPTTIGVIKSVSYDTDNEIFKVTLMDGSKQELNAEQMRALEIGEKKQTNLGQSSNVGEFDGLPLSPEQLQLLNRLG